MDTLVRVNCVKAMVVCLAGSCAMLPGCGHHNSGPDLQIAGESTRLRITDPTPAASPWFDGSRITLVGARGEIVGLQILHRGGGPVTLTFPGAAGGSASAAVRVRGYAVEAFEVRRPSTEMYGGSHGKGSYADGLS